MTALINLPRAAWRLQPQGVVRLNPSLCTGSQCFAYTPIQSITQNGCSKSIQIVDTVQRYTESGGQYSQGLNLSAGVFLPGVNRVRSGNIVYLFVMIPTSTGIGNIAGFGNNGSPTLYVEQFQLNANASGSASAGNFRSVFRNNSGSVTSCTTASPILTVGKLITVAITLKSNSVIQYFVDGKEISLTFGTTSFTDSDTSLMNKQFAIHNFNYGSGSSITALYGIDGGIAKVALMARLDIPYQYAKELSINPWQIFAPAPSRFYLIPGSGAASQTVSFSIDALIQRAGLTQSTSLDALLQSAFSRSLSIDGLIAAVQTSTISMDALLQIVGTRTISIDALLQAVKNGSVSIDALVQMTLAQSLSLDALIQAIQSAGLSLDALLSQSKTATAVVDALIQAAKTGTVSLDALITGASSTTVFVGLDALIQAIQAKTISLDALLQKSYTSPLALDAYVALTQVKTMSLDALLQSTKSGVISMDAILQMTKTAMVSFDALIQAAKTGVISLDAILVLATQASTLLDAYVQKTLSRGVGLDAIIGAIADMILPTGRVISIPPSDRFVVVPHSDRFIQI